MFKYEKRAWERLYHFLEVISEELVAMALYWRAEGENIDISSDPTWPTLKLRMKYAEYFLYNCELTEEGISPVSKKLDAPYIVWKYALLFDYGTTNGLIVREHPEKSFKVSAAFDRDYYVNWGVKFFDTIRQVEKFVGEHPNYEHFSLYKGFDKISFSKTD